MTTSGWSAVERARLTELQAGRTIVVNMRKSGHLNLIRWARQASLFVRVDRAADWGNPYEMPRDGDRGQVCDLHEHDLLNKPVLLNRIGELRGKALGCWCAPARCHADLLAAIADQ